MENLNNAGTPVGAALARGMSYELLARAMPYPDAAVVDSARELAVMVFSAATPACIRQLAEVTFRHSPAALAHEYIEIFTIGTSPDCPTFESAYVCTDDSQQTSVMADVAAFYRAFGLELGEPLRPDDISVELEFMGYLCRKEAYAIEHLGAPRQRQARRAQRIFLQDHLGRWAPALGRGITRRARPGGFYAALGHALADWTLDEQRAFRLLAEDAVDRFGMPRAEGRPVAARAGGARSPARASTRTGEVT